MKKYSLLFASVLLLIFSCGKENSVNPNPDFDPTSNGDTEPIEDIIIPIDTNSNGGDSASQMLKATFDVTDIDFAFCGFVTNNTSITTIITAANIDTTKAVVITIMSDAPTTNVDYNFIADGSATYNSDSKNPDLTNTYISTFGSVRFSSVSSNKLVGTFSFVGANGDNPPSTVSVTNGSFTAIK